MKAIIVGGVVACSFGFASVLLSSPSFTESYWQMLIRLLGAGPAYEAAVIGSERLSLDQAHTLAHAFGTALYREQGIAGTHTCDARIQYGCLHELFGRFVRDHGVAGVQELLAYCSEFSDATACRTGVGHGIISVLGYESENLRQALDVCVAGGEDAMSDGCSRGVFEEFNLRTMQGASVANVRPLDNDPVAGCLSLPEEFKEECVEHLPEWLQWHTFQPAIAEETFVKLAEWCRDSRIGEYQKACFESIGRLISASAREGLEQATERCARLTVSEREERGCVSGVLPSQ